jgi:hypothetical protein
MIFWTSFALAALVTLVAMLGFLLQKEISAHKKTAYTRDYYDRRLNDCRQYNKSLQDDFDALESELKKYQFPRYKCPDTGRFISKPETEKG